MKEINIYDKQKSFILLNPHYKADVEYFIKFVEKRYKLNDESIHGWFSNVDTEHVEDCLRLLCENGTFKRKTKARNFVSALANFFRYLLEHKLSNEKLQNELNVISGADNAGAYYHSRLSEYIENTPMLEDERSFLPITDKEIEKLINYCNNLINKRISYSKGSEAKMFGQMAGALAVKLIMFSGISYGVAKLIEFDDLKPEYGTIEINGILLMLPPQLSYQFKEYARIYKEKGAGISTSKLFVGKDGTSWGDKTPDSGIVAVLRAAIQKTSISEINRGAIQQHMRNGLPERIISQITGEKDSVLSSCFEDVFLDDVGMFSFVNSAIVKNPIYSRL